MNGWGAPRLCGGGRGRGGGLNDCFYLVLHASSTTVATAPGIIIIIILITATECGCIPRVGLKEKDYLLVHLVCSNQCVTCLFPPPSIQSACSDLCLL